jgi:hypothetical protein
MLTRTTRIVRVARTGPLIATPNILSNITIITMLPVPGRIP